VRALLLALLLVLAVPSAAAAQLSEAARELRSDPVYVDPQAELAGAIDADALRERISKEGAAPIYIAVVPDMGDPQQALQQLHDEVGLRGTYAIVAGRSFRAGSDLFPAGQEASAAAQAHQGDVQAALEDFIARVGDLRAGRRPSGSTSGGASLVPLLFLVAIVGVVGFMFVRRGRARRREQEAELVEVKENVRDDLVALGDDIRALDLDMQMPDVNPAARDDYARAVDAYDRANRVFETARTTQELAPAAEALEEGRYAMTAAKARLAGREPPERRPPCFFDPRHGPSSRDVEWAPIGGTPRPVPACEADAQRVERGEDPHARELTVHGQRVPYWEAGPAYAPFYGGFYGGFGSFLPGLLLGSMISGGWDDPSPGDWGGFGGGDLGGGDFGGGDFGGGDFGGGGFGGGDF
jgi:hypothetical protein